MITAFEDIYPSHDDWFRDLQTLEADLHQAIEKLENGVVLNIRATRL